MAQTPQQNPIDRAIAEFSAAHDEARFDQAPAQREKARGLLDHMPAVSPQFPGWVQSMMQAYADSGMTARARSVVEHALARTDVLGISHANRIALLGMMADSWQQDRSLLKAVAYLEQAAAAQESARPVRPDELSAAYIRLADMYRELGRSEALNATITKVRALPNTGKYVATADGGSVVTIDNDNPLARFLERQDLIDDAVAVYREDIDRAANGHDRAAAFQALANLYQRRQQYGDAAETLQRAVAAANAEDLAPLRQSLGIALRQAGRTADADCVYRDLLQTAPGIESLTNYAAHLSATGRAVQAEELLKQYQMNDPFLGVGETHMLLGALDHAAVDVGETDEAFIVALQAIEESSTAADIESIVSMVPAMASALASKQAGGKAEQLYRRLFAVVESRSQDTLTPLLEAAQGYAEFLISRPERWSEVSDANARYRGLLTEAHGAESGLLAEAIEMSIDFEVARESPRGALGAAQELLFLQESLNGNTSEPYLEAINRVAGVYEMNGDPARAVALHRQAVRIADLVYAAADMHRGSVRIEAAFALARQEQFDEAERLAAEAEAIGLAARPSPNDFFRGQREQIRAMRSAPKDDGTARP